MRTSQDKLSSCKFLKEGTKNMATATGDLRSLYGGVNSEVTILGPEGVGGIKNTYCDIHRGVKISIYNPKATAIVIRPFVIELIPTEEGYIATSRISNAYELGATPLRAARTYLEFLVDELIWLQNHEEDLSSSIHEDLRLLQSYLRIV